MRNKRRVAEIAVAKMRIINNPTEEYGWWEESFRAADFFFIQFKSSRYGRGDARKRKHL
jgi:hypothetical protein